jgi:hypothetical protein
MFKRLRSGEQRDEEMAENDEGVEIETGSNDTTQNQTQVAQRGAARSNALPHNIGNLASFFTRHTPPARRTVSAEGGRARTPGKQATLSAVGIEVTPVVGSGTANETEARNYVNKGVRARRRTGRDKTTGDWVIIERDGTRLHRRVWGKENAGTKNVKVVLVTDGVYTRHMKSGEQPGRGLTIIVTTEETEEGARRWRQHKEEGESEEDTSDGARNLGDEMDQAKSASGAEEENESGDSSGESPESAAEADETYVEESDVNTTRREPRKRRKGEDRVESEDESGSEISEEEEEQQEIVNGGEEEEADDEASDMEEQELVGECRYVETRKRRSALT